VLAVAAAGLPQGASAAVQCRFKPAAHVLSVTTTGGTEVRLRRAGTRIKVSKYWSGSGVGCRGAPTVTNTDHINLAGKGFGGIAIDLSHGPFAPGATPEAGSSSEIEFTLTGFGEFELEGGRAPDQFRYMIAGGKTGLNMNVGPEDEDADLLLPHPESSELTVGGGPGPDTIDVVGHVGVEVAAWGGAGNDTLIAGQGGGFLGGSLLVGGSGRDRITGSPASDLIDPGGGADMVEAKGGSDEIVQYADKSPDQIDCGPGRDQVSVGGKGKAVDPFDRLRSCERVKRRR
jgi:hypothetical protein